MSIFNLFAKKPTAAVASTDQAPATVSPAGAVFGARPLQNPAWAGGYTPDLVARILRDAEGGSEQGIADYFALADKVIEREMHTAGVVQSLVLAVAGLPHKAVPRKGDTSKRGQRYADEVAEWLHPAGQLRRVAPGIISQGITHGLGVASVEWDTTGALWTPAAFVHKPAHFYTFDRTDGRTPLLRSATAGQLASPIVPGTALVFAPSRNSALQIKNGLAWILCWAYVIKSIVMADQALFIQTFGHPLVYGQYKRNATPEDVSLLQRAVGALNSTFRAVFRDDLEIKFQEIARSSTDIFEKLCRYLDESISKVVLSNTLSTDGGGGGTYALGKVHAEGKYDVVRSYGYQWAATLQVLADAYVAWNYGPDAIGPRISVEVEEAEDLVANSQIVKNLADAGVPLVASEVRAAFGYREPQPGDDLIGGPAPAAPVAPGQPPAKAPNAAKSGFSGIDLGAGCPVHSAQALSGSAAPAPHDAIDDLAAAMLADWVSIERTIDATLTAAAANATDLDSLRAAMTSAVASLDASALTALLTKARTATHLAGTLGADI